MSRLCVYDLVVSTVLVSEGNGVGISVQCENAVIGDTDSVGIAGEIGQHDLWAGEGTLGVDDPFLMGSFVEELSEGCRGLEGLLLPMELEGAVLVELKEPGAELAPEHGREGMNREEPVWRSAGPTAIFAQSAAGDDAVKVVVPHKRLAPGMKDACHAELSLKFPAPELQKRLRCAGKEKIVARRWVLPDQGVQGVGQRENDVEIWDRQKQVGLLLHPCIAVRALACRTMPVAAGMRDELLLRAIAALVQVAAELRGLAGHDRTQHPPVLRWQTVLLAIVGQFDAELRGPPTKRKSPRRGHSTGLPTKATHKNHVWTWDFIADATVRGGALRTLSVLDEFTRECHILKADRALKSGDVINFVQGAIAQHGAPDHIRSDNGPEFIAKELQRWLAANKIKTLYIEPGSPWQNGFVESFHSRFRDECLNCERLWTLTEARVVIEDYREKYNRVRPHSKLGYQSPARYAASLHPSLAPVRPAEPGLPSARDGQPASVVSASTNHPDRL